MALNSVKILLARLAFCAVVAGLPLVGFAGPAPDGDGDGIPDVIDTCSTVPNAGDCDSDVDGYGNACDGDFNNDGLHTGGDITPFIQALQASDLAGDQNCDGLLTGGDITPFIGALQAAANPGPSGLACAGTIPCK